MARKVEFSEKTADELLALHEVAAARGLSTSFRRAWMTIWDALHHRPLPPDESDSVFGEILYRTKHQPRHTISVVSVAPLSVQFAVCEDEVVLRGESVTAVMILKAILMS